MLKRFLLLAGSSLLLINSSIAAAPSSVQATLTGLDCSGDYCQLIYTANNKTQQGVCADETYCEPWSDDEKLPKEFLNKTATLQVERQHLDDADIDVDVIKQIKF